MHLYLVHIWGGWPRSPHPRDLKMSWRQREMISQIRINDGSIPILLVAAFKKTRDLPTKSPLDSFQADTSCLKRKPYLASGFRARDLELLQASSEERPQLLGWVPSIAKGYNKVFFQATFPPYKTRSRNSWIRTVDLEVQTYCAELFGHLTVRIQSCGTRRSSLLAL